MTMNCLRVLPVLGQTIDYQISFFSDQAVDLVQNGHHHHLIKM